MNSIKKFGSQYHVGLLHLHEGMLCQDRALANYQSRVIRDGESITVIGISDGISACEYSEHGATFAMKYLKKNAERLYDAMRFRKTKDGEEGDVVWDEGSAANWINESFIPFLHKMGEEAEEYAGRIGAEINDFHCTMSFAIIGLERFLCVSIGDSPLYLQTKGDGFLWLDGNTSVEEPCTHSVYGIDNLAMKDMKISVGFIDDLQAILAISDGCLGFPTDEGKKANITEAFPEWFFQMAEGSRTEEETIIHLVNTGYDDCSFAYYINDESFITDRECPCIKCIGMESCEMAEACKKGEHEGCIHEDKCLCPRGGCVLDNCRDCCYEGEYAYVNGECIETPEVPDQDEDNPMETYYAFLDELAKGNTMSAAYATGVFQKTFPELSVPDVERIIAAWAARK